jgi:hypothetical protein
VLKEEELAALKLVKAGILQKIVRGYLGRRLYRKVSEHDITLCCELGVVQLSWLVVLLRNYGSCWSLSPLLESKRCSEVEAPGAKPAPFVE